MKKVLFSLFATVLMMSCEKAWHCTTKKTTNVGGDSYTDIEEHKFVGTRAKKKIHEELYSGQESYSGIVVITETKCFN